MADIPGGKYLGTDADGIATSEADHHMKCPGCGQWFDMRDLGQVLSHDQRLDSRPSTERPYF